MRLIRTATIISLAILIIGCARQTDATEPKKLYVDINGLALNTSNDKILVNVGVGETGEEFLTRNPSLRGVVWNPQDVDGHAFNEMRFALQSDAEVAYSDGDISFNVCAHSISADGNSSFRHGVAFVGIKLCESPINNYKRAIELAAEVVKKMESSSPNVKNFSTFYQTASVEELAKIGGNLWKDNGTRFFKDLPPRRNNPDSGEYLFSPTEAEKYFANKLANPSYKQDINDLQRPITYHVLLGVFAGEKTIFEIGVSSKNNYGGTNLTQAQMDELRYDITMGIRFRNDVSPNASLK